MVCYLPQVADTIWICEKQTVTKWEGDILSYKDHLKAKVMKESKKNAKSKFITEIIQNFLQLLLLQVQELASLPPAEGTGNQTGHGVDLQPPYYVNTDYKHIFL